MEASRAEANGSKPGGSQRKQAGWKPTEASRVEANGSKPGGSQRKQAGRKEHISRRIAWWSISCLLLCCQVFLHRSVLLVAPNRRVGTSLHKTSQCLFHLRVATCFFWMCLALVFLLSYPGPVHSIERNFMWVHPSRLTSSRFTSITQLGANLAKNTNKAHQNSDHIANTLKSITN